MDTEVKCLPAGSRSTESGTGFQTESNGNKGALLKNGVTPDGYKVGADGSWVRN